MRRRSPPSSLRLFQGPLPPRSHPKHTLPSVPCPAFHPEAFIPRDPAPVPRTRHCNNNSSPSASLSHADLLPLSLELAAICRPSSSLSSVTSASSGMSGTDSPTSTSSPVSAKRVRGPWDDSASVGVVVDVDSLLAWPKPVAIGV